MKQTKEKDLFNPFFKKSSLLYSKAKHQQYKKPYNINISFNINPKNIVNQQIDKIYNIGQDDYNSLYQLKQAAKKQKNNCKFDCYMQNQNNSKTNSRVKKNSVLQKDLSKQKNKKNKNQDKHKSSQTILKQKFIKLNKMKKSLLQKIGSLDITLSNNQNQNHQHKYLKYPNQKQRQKTNKNKEQNSFEQLELAQSKQMQNNQYKQLIRKCQNIKQQDLITQKLSEYQPEQLISFQNQKSDKQQKTDNLDISDSFPMIFHNSLAIKKQYQKNYNQNFINTNNQSKSRSKKNMNKKNNKISEIKAPISARLHKQSQKNKNNKIKKEDNYFFNKIKVMHEKLLSSQSLKNMYNSTQLNDNENYKNKPKQFIIKTENQFQALKNQIQFYCQLNQFQQKTYEKEKQNDKFTQNSKDAIKIGLISQILENQEYRPTQQIIQSYVYQIAQMTQIRKLKEQIQNKKNNEKNNKIQQDDDQNRNFDFQSSQSQGQNQCEFRNQDYNIQKNKELSQQSSSNCQKQSQKSELSFTFALNETQLLKQRNQQCQKKELCKGKLDRTFQYSQNLLQNIKKNCDSYFLQENQVYVKKIQKQQKKYLTSENEQKQEQDHKGQQQNSDVDSYIFGGNQFYHPNNQIKSSSSSQNYIQDQDQLTLRRLNKLSLQKKMRQQLQMRLIKLKLQKKNPDVDNSIKGEINEKNQNEDKLQLLMNFIKNQLSKQKQQHLSQQNNQDNNIIIKEICQQLEKMLEKMKNQQSQIRQSQQQIHKNDSLIQNKKNTNIHEFHTPIKKQQIYWQKQVKKHNRNLSTQNKQIKLQQNSNDLTLWDLQLLQSSLNRRYKDISANKQKIFQQIAADQTLDDYSFFKKVKDLKQWERQNKEQILKTKIKINKNIKNYIKIINQDSDEQKKSSLPKCFSQQYIKLLNSNQQKTSKNSFLIKGQIKQMNKRVNQNQLQLIFKKQDRLYLKNNNSSQNSEQQQQERQIQQFQRLKQKHYNSFKQDDSRSSESSAIQNNQYYFDQTNSEDEQIIKLQNQKGQFAELMNRPLFKLNQIDAQGLVEFEEPHYQISQLQLNLTSRLVTQQQKLDIFQFIFLDLCIQLYQDTIDFEQKQIHKGKLNSGPQRILDSIWKYLKNQKKTQKKKGPKIGIYTGLSTVKQYLQKLLTFLMTYKQKNKETLILNRLDVPLGPTAFELLKSMRFNTQYDYDQDSNAGNFQNQALNSLVLPIYTFTDFQSKIQNQKEFQFQKYFDEQEKQKNRLIFLKNMTHVHHKAIFDALNQMLDFQRPFGIWGKPFPWKKIVREIIRNNQQTLNLSIKKSSQKVNECAMYMCGLLVDKEESLVRDANISSTYLQEVKEDRMSKLIINDFIQNQSRWSFLDDQQTQVLLQVSYIIWVVMLQETLKQLKPIFNRQLQSE